MSLTRVQWMSEGARAVWEPRLSAVSRAWSRVEVASVEAGLRPACYVDAPAAEYESRWRELGERGLSILVADVRGTQQGYAARSVPATAGGPVTTRLAVGRTVGASLALVAATRAGDDELIGALLGYPECCRASFRDWWGTRTEPPVAGHEHYSSSANLFLRWIGVRAVPHLPCRMDCKETALAAVRVTRLMPEPERSWLWDALKWPTLYTARNGIAVVETPVLRIVGEADPGTRRVELPGSAWPVEGAVGVEFPLRTPQGAVRRLHEGFLRPEHEVNGFASMTVMLDAHEEVLRSLPARAEGAERVVDLGCGSGRLASLVAGLLGLPAAGCDVKSDAVSWAKRAYPSGDWWAGDAEGYAPMPGDLILATPNRQPATSGSEAAVWTYEYRGEGGFTDGTEPARLEVA